MELEINGKIYTFTAGMGFLREINKTVATKVEGIAQNVGLRVTVANLIDGNVEALATVLQTANKGNNPRLTSAELDKYLENPETDINGLFDQVLDFLSTANVTKKTVQMIQDAVEEKQKA
jgi:acylphosphatase